MVPMARIERATSPLPRECSTTELHGHLRPREPAASFPPIRKHAATRFRIGAGEGNASLRLPAPSAASLRTAVALRSLLRPSVLAALGPPSNLYSGSLR